MNFSTRIDKVIMKILDAISSVFTFHTNGRFYTAEFAQPFYFNLATDHLCTAGSISQYNSP